MKFFVFGNPLVPQDAGPYKILPFLKKQFPQIEFIIVDPNEDWAEGEKDLNILDTVLGLTTVTLFDSLDRFYEQRRKVSLHDYDLLNELRLLQKLGKITKVRIIGLPPKFTPEKLQNQVARLISQEFLKPLNFQEV